MAQTTLNSLAMKSLTSYEVADHDRYMIDNNFPVLNSGFYIWNAQSTVWVSQKSRKKICTCMLQVVQSAQVWISHSLEIIIFLFRQSTRKVSILWSNLSSEHTGWPHPGWPYGRNTPLNILPYGKQEKKEMEITYIATGAWILFREDKDTGKFQWSSVTKKTFFP